MNVTTLISTLVVLCCALGQPLSAASYFKHITIDGSFADWAGVPPSTVDPLDSPTATDIDKVYLAHDAQYIYIRFTLHAPGDPFTSHNNFFIDADGNGGTGFNAHGIGSEMLIQSGAGYQEKNGGFNEGGINGLDWSAAPSGVATDFELRISRAATYAGDGLPVFTSPNIAVLLEAEDAGFVPREFAPDSGGIAYELTAPPPSAPPGAIRLAAVNDTWWVNQNDIFTNAAWSDPSYNPFGQDAWEQGEGLFGFSPTPGVYPLPLLTALSPGRPTYYARIDFQWDYDPAGVLLIASNHLSDGAVVYLNGAEAGRLRVADRPVTYNSRASGGPATPGAVERLVLPAQALIVGQNTLAIEAHQTGADNTDLVFGLSLLATDAYPVFITDAAEPANRSVIEGESTTFLARVAGSGPITYQWLKNGAPIADATNAAYTIALVQRSDVGAYSVRVSNPLAANVTSRAAVLTTIAVPVTITNAAEPADRTVLQGTTTTFLVRAAGSAPLYYQWSKNGAAIANATNDTYTIANASLLDAGNYRVVVSNLAPSSATSRVARLTVTADAFPPTVAGVSGSPNVVRVTFSEPIDPFTGANPANYTLSGGVAVNAAALDAGDPATVILTTGPQTLRTLYTLTINGVKDLFNNSIAANTRATFLSTIIIDGSFDDWAGVPLAFADPQDSTESEDWNECYVTHDDDFIYVRVTLHAPGEPSDFHNNIFIDADNTTTTGYRFVVGSEMLIQGGGGYQQKNGGFNEGGILGLDWAIAPSGGGTNFEFRISRHARYANDNLPVFAGNAIAFVLESESDSFVTKDTAPNSAGFQYRLSLDSLLVSYGGGGVQVSWSGPGVLQSRSSLSSGDWTDEADQTNPHLEFFPDTTKFFRLIQR